MRLWQEAEEFRLRSIALKIKVSVWICTWHSYITVLKYKPVKPMRKSSKPDVTFDHYEWNEWWSVRERRMVWSSYEAAGGMDFRGRSEITVLRVGADGNRTRYQSGVYVCTWESGRFVNLSGTAIIRIYYRLKEQRNSCFWGGFLCSRKFRWNLLLHKKPYRAGSHCGGKVDVAWGDPPQAENPAKRDSFLVTTHSFSQTKCRRSA